MRCVALSYWNYCTHPESCLLIQFRSPLEPLGTILLWCTGFQGLALLDVRGLQARFNDAERSTGGCTSDRWGIAARPSDHVPEKITFAVRETSVSLHNGGQLKVSSTLLNTTVWGVSGGPFCQSLGQLWVWSLLFFQPDRLTYFQDWVRRKYSALQIKFQIRHLEFKLVIVILEHCRIFYTR